jgi:hypothetical protein
MMREKDVQVGMMVEVEGLPRGKILSKHADVAFVRLEGIGKKERPKLEYVPYSKMSVPGKA